MIEILAVAALLLLFLLLNRPKNIKKGFVADEKENGSRKQHNTCIVGASRFVMDSVQRKPTKVNEPQTDFAGKLDIEIPLDYEPENTDLLEEQEELERLGLQADYSSNITFDEMMAVVNEVGNEQTISNPGTGKLLYENENTDWVEQLASSNETSAKRIASLIDLHLGRLVQPEKLIQPNNDGLRRFDIGEYVR
ncbi:MAG: hypothetical protein JXR61_04445 [Prolixibacteraceae bacterium]|nr:hypothetical protein [Prolixibacteraceae bacterium]